MRAEDVVAELIAADEGRHHRQLHVMDRHGRFAAYTGAACIDWCGHELRGAFSVAGNMLVGSAVLAETIPAFEVPAAGAFAPRLIAAIPAGGAAGRENPGSPPAPLLV